MSDQDSNYKAQHNRSNQNYLWGIPTTVVSFAIIAFTSVVVYRLVTAPISIQFDFTALLSLLMALFAIALSALFYFKTTQTSNLFYDNTYRFTKDMSEILGRIEAGFGERLRHLDEGYTGLRDTVAKLPFDMPEAREKEQKEKQEIAKKEGALQKMMEELAKRAQLGEVEKEKLFRQLNEKQKELENAYRQLHDVQLRITHEQDAEDLSSGTEYPYFDQLREDVRRLLPSELSDAPPSTVNKAFSQVVSPRLHHRLVVFMTRRGIIDPDRGLTERGVALIRRFLQDTDNPHHPSTQASLRGTH